VKFTAVCRRIYCDHRSRCRHNRPKLGGLPLKDVYVRGIGLQVQRPCLQTLPLSQPSQCAF
jgi:hypothetical protein